MRKLGLTFVEALMDVYLIKPPPGYHKLQRSVAVRRWWKNESMARSAHSARGMDALRAAWSTPTPVCPPPRVAVCFAGSLGTFLSPEVQSGLVSNLHREGYDYFVSTDTPLLLNDSRLRVTLQSAFADDGGAVTGPVEPRGWRKPPCLGSLRMFPTVQRFAACFTMMQDAERARGARYDFLVRMRPDVRVLLPLPRLDELFRSYGAGKDALLYEDQMSISPRSIAASLTVTPQLAYRSCVTLAMWAQACGEAQRVDTWLSTSGGASAPCCPMLLVSLFDDVALRDCGDVQGGTCMPLPCSVDIAREGHLNETCA
jgi:hypothetical protein